MRDRRRGTPPLFATAALSYLLNCALGTAVATKLIDTSRFRWLHHAMFILTCASTAVALGFGLGGRRSSRRAALALAPAVAPLAVIPYAGTRGRRHPLVALSAAPFFAASLVVLALDPDRRK